MPHAHYLVVGGSHAALEAVNAIRMCDADNNVTLLTRDRRPPYSPTALPYVVSGRASPEKLVLRTQDDFARQRVDYRAGAELARINPERKVAVLSDGAEIAFEKLLLATGASPAIPPIPGVETVPYHVLRTMDDALRLKQAIAKARRAVVLGAGLVGMHAAEHLVEAGAEVAIVEMQEQVLGACFDAAAAAHIERAFVAHGARVLTGRRVIGLARRGTATDVRLDDGQTLEADLLLVATGVKPNMDFLAGSGVARDRGILVDDAMRTNVKDIWAAGDCAQAKNFHGGGPVINAILPVAAEQGRIAGMAMAGDPGLKPYPGSAPLNTYRFFGRHALAVGAGDVPPGGAQRVRADDAGYLRVVIENGCLRGIFSVNHFFDAGVMRELILRRVPISDALDRLVADPLTTGREFMSRLWK
ncbi:FAD-dependent oxidoreductase [Rhodoblastus sphagnicola]|uniref:FAD-dependent oxidoreductase n=1 Tax=Rhodoblastus sphagnicola TaxID=333368 RepID=A0A2S6N036_9HYPH|nr:FAD-dependent oxidoreductase [Rhodoblastus sphagnicola]MBB4197893.1 phenylglyoxylate dehydrogenase epsilon subunit [Rhodoblastus sphagnicola]PPQ27958.1 FAD-dependent oxidoreductase [Rhodoblastus sphagnicola]